MGIRRSIREYAGLPPKKFTQALSYAISKTSSQPKVGKTLLYKIMYFADFDFYELNEILLTGEKYRSITHGPAPVHFDKAIAALKASGEIREARVGNGPYVQVKYESLKDPDVPELSDEEKAHMDKVVQRLSRMTATGVSKYVHKDLPVKATKPGELINPELVFYRDEDFSVRTYPNDSSE